MVTTELNFFLLHLVLQFYEMIFFGENITKSKKFRLFPKSLSSVLYQESEKCHNLFFD
jgi:hypothetical protein